MKILDRLALLILILAGIHLLLIGLLSFNVFEEIFGEYNQNITDIIYIIAGIAALWCIKYFSYTPKGGSRLKGRWRPTPNTKASS